MSEECYVNPKEIIEVIHQYSNLLEQEGRDGSWPAWIESAILHGIAHRRPICATWHNVPYGTVWWGSNEPPEWVCSHCDERAYDTHPYCPNCGTRMRMSFEAQEPEEEEENDGNI